MTYIYYFVIIAGKWNCYGKHTDWNRPPWPGTILTICVSCFMTGDPGKEHGTNKPPSTGRVQERSKWDTTCPTTPRILLSSIHLGWTRHAPPGRTLGLEWLARDNLETNPITIKPETTSHVTELFSWFPLPCCSPLGCPFPVNSLALSADVSPQTSHFQGLDKSPVSGPGREPLTAANALLHVQCLANERR